MTKAFDDHLHLGRQQYKETAVLAVKLLTHDVSGPRFFQMQEWWQGHQQTRHRKACNIL